MSVHLQIIDNTASMQDDRTSIAYEIISDRPAVVAREMRWIASALRAAGYKTRGVNRDGGTGQGFHHIWYVWYRHVPCFSEYATYRSDSFTVNLYQSDKSPYVNTVWEG